MFLIDSAEKVAGAARAGGQAAAGAARTRLQLLETKIVFLMMCRSTGE